MKIANHPLLASVFCLALPLASAVAAESAPQATTSQPGATASKRVPGAKDAAAETTPQQGARYFAGLGAKASDAEGRSLQKRAGNAWIAYEKHVGQPLLTWANKEVAYSGGGTVFYPFSGPDFLTVERIYPNADRYVLVAQQAAKAPARLEGMDESQRAAFVKKLGDAWNKFGRLRYFRTEDLDEDQRDPTVSLGVTTILMAFAARLGYEVVEVAPLHFSAAEGEWKTLPASESEWKSVRLSLQKDGRKVTLDYLSVDLSDDGMRAHKAQRAWFKGMAGSPILLKAASHLLQEPYFGILRDMLVKNAPLVVQDETGLTYQDLSKVGSVRLYGNFARVHRLFKSTDQASLAAAYKAEKSPGALPFAFSYLKDSEERSIQIARRSSPSQEGSSDGQKKLSSR